MTKDFSEDLTKLKEIAKNIISNGEHHQPIFFPIKNENITNPILLSTKKKHPIQDTLKKFTKQHKTEEFILITESWFPKNNKKQECLLIILTTQNNKKTILIPFKRTENNVTFKKEKTIKELN